MAEELGGIWLVVTLLSGAMDRWTRREENHFR